MPGSTVSLGSLSSPSPSPPPPEEQHSNHSGAAGLDSGSELSELTEDEQDDHRTKEDNVRNMTRKRKPRGLVPQDMWDWAVKKKPEKKEKSDWRTKMVEEEEEEEQAGPAKAMEEEEEDDHGKESGSDRGASPDKDGALSDNEVDDIDEEDLPEDEGEYGDEPLPQDAAKDANGEVFVDENDDAEDADPDAPDVLQSPKPVASPDLSDDENQNFGEDEIDDDDIQDAGATTKEGSELDEDEEDVAVDDVEAPDADELPTTEAVTPVEAAVDVLDADPDMTMEVDVVQPVLMSPVAVAASSIMAGASLMQQQSPSSSQRSTPSASRVSSRFPSAEPEQEQDIPSEHEAEPEPERKPLGRGGRSRKVKGRTRAARRSRAAAAAEAGEADGDVDTGENLDGDGGDGDEDVATPDIDMDSDMQPAHRAEALDVLATIELKFALLRERLYVEKMDALAWEEGLIADGMHPELLHLHAELSSRRDKRLELAARRRDFEVENVMKRRRLDEAGTYSWWTNERDELQTQMIAETNGKKRKLERERKILERPQPMRRFPLPLREVPPAPSLRDIVKSNTFGVSESSNRSRRSRKKISTPTPFAYPTLASLSRGEILQDLDLFYSHQHVPPVAFDPHRNMPGLMNAVLGGMPHGMDPYAIGMQVVDGSSRFPTPVQQHLPQLGPHGYNAHSRLPHHHSAPPGALPPIPPSHLQLEQEYQLGIRKPQHPHMQQQFGGPGPGTLMRRSISPVPLANGAGSSSVPTTIGGGPVPPGFVAAPKANGWSDYTKRLNGEHDGRERERLNERDRLDRDRLPRDLDRERERQRPHSVHPHQHGQGQSSHHHAHNHGHQHHHHHVHHHHHPAQPGVSGPAGNVPPPMVGLSTSGNAGPPQTLSPHNARDFEQHRSRSGAATEVIELATSSQKPPASLSGFWKGNDGPPLPPDDNPREREQDRGRASGPLSAETHERLMTPFPMGSSQAPQPSLPGSPRNAPGAGGVPSNMPSSRRGSWSTSADDLGLARPSSASLMSSGPQVSQRAPSTRLSHQPSGPPFHSPYGSPPHSNGRALPPPTSPSAFVDRRMPLGRPSSPPSMSLSLVGSPGSKLPRPSSPGLSRASLPKMGGFPIPESGNIAPIVTGTSGHRPRTPAPLPAPSALLPPIPTALGPGSRLLSSALSEKAPPQLSGPPPTKVVPVDG